MDVLILSASFGGGHMAVSEALEEHLRSDGINSHIIDLYHMLNPKLNQLNSKFYIKLMRYAPQLYGLFYNLTYDLGMDNIFNKIGSFIGRAKLVDILNKYNPKVVVSTYPTYTGMLSYLKKEEFSHIYAMTVITDFVAHSQWIHKHVDAYFVASQEVAFNLMKKGIPPNRVEVSGIPIKSSFSKHYNREFVLKKYGLKPDKPVILIMNIAFGNLKIYHEVFSCLMDIKGSFQGVVLCGENEKLYKKVVAYKDKLVPLVGKVDIAELMSVSDILISKSGGITTSEALSMGLPIVIYKPVPGQEMHNADYVSRHGAGVIVKKREELKNLLNILLENPELRMKMGEKAKELGKPYAAKYIARYISDVLRKL